MLACLVSMGCSQNNNENALDASSNSHLLDDANLRMPYTFLCYQDFLTYLSTGSKNEDDYILKEETSDLKREMFNELIINGLPEPDVLEEWYVPIDSLFCINDELLNRDYLHILIEDHENVVGKKSYEFIYYFEDLQFGVGIGKADFHRINFMDASLYDEYALAQYIDGTFRLVRVTERDEMRSHISFVINDCFVEIYLNGVNWRDDRESEKEWYENLMTSPEFAAFSAFFSDDPEVLGPAVQNLKDKAAAMN